MVFAKRLLSITLAGAMTASLAGCKNDDTSSKEEATTTAPIVESVGDLDYSDVPISLNAVAVDEVFEAENGQLSASITTAQEEDVTYVTGFTGEELTIDFELDIPSTGFYDLAFISRGTTSSISNTVYIDGELAGRFLSTVLGFKEETVPNVFIAEGTHTLTVETKEGGFEMDKFSIKSLPARTNDISYEVSKELSNPNSNDITRRLYSFLCDTYGKYILSGQHADKGEESREMYLINKHTGKVPAILSLDLINASPSRVAMGGTSGAQAKLSAKTFWNDGGIISMCWHWNAPEDYLEKGSEPWYSGFYTKATTFNLKAALDGTDPAGYDLLIRDIDAIAAEIKELEEAGIPLLWRPLHEASGGWFWWGASGAEAYKELWVLLYDRLTNYHQCNNLIWVWNGQSADWYPGDEYCDIVSWDIYATNHDYSSQSETFHELMNIPSENKIVTLSENGVLFDPDLAMADGCRWAWFAVWSGDFVVAQNTGYNEGYTELYMLEKVYAHDRVLTRDELPDIKCYPMN